MANSFSVEQAARRLLNRPPTRREQDVLDWRVPQAEKALALVRLQIPVGVRVPNGDLLRAGMIVEAGLMMRGNWL